jgi:hypothetical protein
MAVPMARGAVAEIQASEKSEATEHLPEIDQPTGLPTLKSTASPKKTALTPGQAPDAPTPEARAAEPTESAPPEPSGPVPGSQISTAVSEPHVAEEDSGSWWSWLVDRVQNFLSSVPTSDPELSTSAGPRDHVDLSGDADPSQNAHHEEESHTEVTARQTEADSATSEDFGEHRIFPSVPTKRMRPTYQPSGARGAAGGRSPGSPPVLPDKERAEFDHNASPALNEQMQEHAARQHAERAEYERKTTEAHEEGERRLEEENTTARLEQEEQQRKARGEVETGRENWRAENRKIREDFGTQSSAKRAEIDKQIGDKVRTSEADVDQKLTEAEKTAYEEKRKAEAEAAEKKREAENRPQSWWERAKGAVSDVFSAIKSVVNGIFDRVRAAVKTIIDKAKSIVHGIIDAARNAIVGLIKGFGEALKGLVTIALAAFPETAARAREWIDTKVDAATETVNRVADRLKRAADVILDTVAKAIDIALSVMQASFNAALDVAEFLALAPFEAMEALADLVALLEKIGPFIEGAQRVQDNPDAVIDGLKASIGAMIAEVPGRAYAALEEALSRAGATAKRHFDGVWRHLSQGLEHLKTSWWEEVKKLGWNLLWPWPAVWKDLKQIWDLIGVAGTAIGNLQVSKAIDTGLKITQLLNGILGNLYGWFFIASVLIGTIVGAFFGGAGAIPGFWAGVAFAGEVGEGLLAVLIATEMAVITKSGVDLALGENTPSEDEEDYGQIAGSVLTLAITGALVLVGEIAAKLAKAVWEGVSGLFKGGEAPEAGVRVDAPEGAGEGAGERAGEGPQAEPAPAEGAEPRAEPAPAEGAEPQAEPAPAEGAEPQAEPRAAEGEPEVVDREPIVAEEPVGNGEHEVKVTEDGEVLFCSDCAKLRREFAEELSDPANRDLSDRLDAADAIEDPELKAKTEAEIAADLAEVRSEGYGEVQKRLGLSDGATQILREKGVRPSLVEDLLNKGFNGDYVALVAEESGIQGVEVLKGLTDARVQPHVAEKVVGSAQKLGVMDDVASLVRDGSLSNPQKLNAMLTAIENGDRGALNELRIAADLAREGHGVELATQGDIVDLGRPGDPTSTPEVMQVKEVSSGAEVKPHELDAFTRNLQEAENQLAGLSKRGLPKAGEQPLPGFRRVADISIVHPDNPLFTADREALSRAINDALRGRMVDGAPAVERVRIRNSRGVEVFEGPDFAP